MTAVHATAPDATRVVARDGTAWWLQTTNTDRPATRRELAFVARCADHVAAAPEAVRWRLFLAYLGVLGAMTADEPRTYPFDELSGALARRVAPRRPVTNGDVCAFIHWADARGWGWAAAAVGVGIHDLAREVAAWRNGTLQGADPVEFECAVRHFVQEFADGGNA